MCRDDSLNPREASGRGEKPISSIFPRVLSSDVYCTKYLYDSFPFTYSQILFHTFPVSLSLFVLLSLLSTHLSNFYYTSLEIQFSNVFRLHSDIPYVLDSLYQYLFHCRKLQRIIKLKFLHRVLILISKCICVLRFLPLQFQFFLILPHSSP